MGDLAKRAVGRVGFTSKLLGHFIPGVGTIGEVIDWYKSQRRKKYVERLKRHLELVDRRLTDLQRQLTPEEVDLFEEILEAAVREEDKAKSAYYAGLVEYYVRHETDAAVVRLLANSLKALSAWELMILRKLHKGGQKVFFRSDVLGQSVFLRLEGLGLYDGKQTPPRKVTPLGKMLREVIELADEAHPDTP